MRKIRWAICGLGRIAERFLTVCNGIENCEVVATASSDKRRAEEFAVRHNLKYAYTYDELYKSKEIDAVYIATNMSVHCPNTLGLLANRIPMLCEKSFSLDDLQAAKMITSAKQNDTLLMEAMWTRFLPSTQKVVELVRSGMLGAITHIDGIFAGDMRGDPDCRIFKKELGGGSVLDIGVYVVAYVYALLGVPSGISASGIVEGGVDHECNFELTYDCGAKAKLLSSVIREYRANMEITCQKGKITIPDFFGAKSVEVEYADKTKKQYTFEDIDGFVYQIRHFNELLRTGKKQSLIQTFEDTYQVMKILTEANRQMGVVL
ncbi:MAG: Gfo/Idh/MocA family oxidoreductase [Firmicutes bacterium]|nr:Gfo/Idh/MocA family oxidoreductase [Bacillota bacterium]